MLWTALETLASETLVSAVNAVPGLAERLVVGPAARRFGGLKSVPLETLATFRYNMAHRLGTYALSLCRLDDLQTIRLAFGALLPRDRVVRQALGSQHLWTLNQRRNLIVHRRGRIDRDYLRNTGGGGRLGSELRPATRDVEDGLRLVRRVGMTLLDGTSRELGKGSPRSSVARP